MKNYYSWLPQLILLISISHLAFHPGFDPRQVSPFLGKLFHGRHDSANFAEKLIFPKFLAYPERSLAGEDYGKTNRR